MAQRKLDGFLLEQQNHAMKESGNTHDYHIQGE